MRKNTTIAAAICRALKARLNKSFTNSKNNTVADLDVKRRLIKKYEALHKRPVNQRTEVFGPSKRLLVSLALVTTAFSFSASAQCNSLIKEKAIPGLAPFVHNGMLNSGIISTGETAELKINFYAGKDYRLMVWGEEVLGDVNFTIKDPADNILFNSADIKDTKKYYDFNVPTNQRLKVVVSSAGAKELIKDGCISVMVGLKETIKPAIEPGLADNFSR